MDRPGLNLLLEKTERYYLNGLYSKFQVHMDEIREQVSASTFSELGMDASTLALILENNLIVAECLELKWNADESKETWDQLLLRFLSLHERCADTQLESMSQEFHLRLNLAHNFLFWSWVNPQVFQNNKDLVEKSLLLVIKCLRSVLDFFHKSCFAFENLNSKMIVLNLMKLSSAHNILFYNEGSRNIGIQLLEIYFFTTQIIVESFESTGNKQDRKSLESCANFIETIVNLKPLFKTCLQANNQKENCSTTINVSQFKFGLHKINSRVGDFDVDAVFNALCFAGSLCYLKLQQYKPSLACLSLHNTCESDRKPSFILNYLVSYIYYQLNDFENSLLFVRKILDLTLDKNMNARSILLHGLILSSQGQFLKAQKEFHKVQEIDSYVPVVLYYSALNYKLYSQSHLHDGETSIQSGRQSEDQRKRLRETVPVNELPISALNALVHSLQNYDSASFKINNSSASLEIKLLSVIHTQPEITALHAIYLLARELAAGEEFLDSADKLLYLLTVQHHDHLEQLGLVRSLPLPPTNILMHETIAVLIQGKRWNDAEIVCRKSLSTCTNLGEALIPNMFLAQIQEYKEKGGDALNTLIKCLNSVGQWMAMESTQREPEAKHDELGNHLAAKICVHIALIYINKQLLHAAVKHLKRALCYSKVDKDALYHLILALKSHITTSHELWESHQTTFNNVDKKWTNIALNYLLRTRVTKEQVEQLSVHFLVNDPSFLEEFEDMEED